MRYHTSPVFITLVALATSCASPTGAERSANTQRSAENLSEQYQDLSAQIEATIKVLDTVVTPPANSDLRKSFASFVAAFDKLEAQGNRVRSGADELKSNTSAQISGWEHGMAQVQNAALRESSAQRRAAAEKSFAEATAELDRFDDSFVMFKTDLLDIKTALDNDLNAAGVNTLKGAIDTAKSRSQTVLKEIPPIIKILDGISAAGRG